MPTPVGQGAGSPESHPEAGGWCRTTTRGPTRLRESRELPQTLPQSPTDDIAPAEGSASENDPQEREGRERRDDPEGFAKQRRLATCKTQIQRAVTSGSKPSPAREKSSKRGPLDAEREGIRCDLARITTMPSWRQRLRTLSLPTGPSLWTRQGPTNRPDTGVSGRPGHEG